MELVNTQMLDEAIEKAGFTNASLADAISISRSSLYLKKTNKREFKGREIKAICDKLGLDLKDKDLIFFANCVAV